MIVNLVKNQRGAGVIIGVGVFLFVTQVFLPTITKTRWGQ